MLAGSAAPAQFDVLCLSHLRWDFVYQRPQHLMERWAENQRVFFIEEPTFDDDGPLRLDVLPRGRVTLVVPRLPRGIAAEEVEPTLRGLLDGLLADHSITAYVLWYYTPMALGFTDHLAPLGIIYDCMDELSLFAGAPPILRQRELELFRRADLVFTGGQSLYEAKRLQHPRVWAFPSSVDVPHFKQARAITEDPADQAAIPHPRLGFYGVIDERLDLRLLTELADLRPDWQFVLVGPVVKIDPAILPRRPNIHYLGPKSYTDLPKYLAGWDVALLPFARNDSTRFISPTKTPEYLAAGRPVVSTSIRDVVRPYGERGLARIADTAPDFAGAVAAALREDAAQRLQEVDAFLARISWDLTWARMQVLTQSVCGARAEAVRPPAPPAPYSAPPRVPPSAAQAQPVMSRNGDVNGASGGESHVEVSESRSPAPLSHIFKSFWIAGFEAASHLNRAGQRVDMLAVTQHDRQVMEDYARLREIGIRTARDGIRWHLIDQGGRFDFSSLAPMVEAARAADIQVIWGLCHFGWPEDVDLFAPAFVNRFARYCGAVARFIKDHTDAPPFYTPINEMSFLSWAAGGVGYIYPYGQNRATEVKRQLVRAVIAGAEALWAVDPRARIISTEPGIHVVPPLDRPDMAAEAARVHESQFEAWDMLGGVTEPGLGGHPRYLDVLGINFYHDNQWEHPGARRLGWSFKPLDERWLPLHRLLAETYRRYRRPVFVGETSHFGSGRAAWLRDIGTEIDQALALGIPVEGVCIYPILDRPDWDNSDHWHHSGLWDLVPDADGQLQRVLHEEYAAELRRLQQRPLPVVAR